MMYLVLSRVPPARFHCLMSPLTCYLKTHRKRLGLTQNEFAMLVGGKSEACVSRLERLTRKPDIETAFACQVLFDVSVHEVFPGIYASVEQAVIDRARLLVVSLENDGPSPYRDHKLKTLGAILSRPSGAR